MPDNTPKFGEWQPESTAPFNAAVLIHVEDWEHYGYGVCRANQGRHGHWCALARMRMGHWARRANGSSEVVDAAPGATQGGRGWPITRA